MTPSTLGWRAITHCIAAMAGSDCGSVQRNSERESKLTEWVLMKLHLIRQNWWKKDASSALHVSWWTLILKETWHVWLVLGRGGGAVQARWHTSHKRSLLLVTSLLKGRSTGCPSGTALDRRKQCCSAEAIFNGITRFNWQWWIDATTLMPFISGSACQHV